jgi:hypothetical protein
MQTKSLSVFRPDAVQRYMHHRSEATRPCVVGSCMLVYLWIVLSLLLSGGLFVVWFGVQSLAVPR